MMGRRIPRPTLPEGLCIALVLQGASRDHVHVLLINTYPEDFEPGRPQVFDWRHYQVTDLSKRPNVTWKRYIQILGSSVSHLPHVLLTTLWSTAIARKFSRRQAPVS